MKFTYGTVLKIEREFTDQDIERRLQKIKKSGMNQVVIWPAVYWWEDCRNSSYPYGTGKRILEMAEALGLRIIMELAGQITVLEAIPDYLMKEEYLAVKRDGSYKNDRYGYDFLNYNHPEVKSLIQKYYRETAEAYHEYPALRGYDIWNETMFESFDIHTLHAFRLWLKGKYGRIQKLNDVWDRVYTDWSQVVFSNWCWSSVMCQVDFREFQRDNVADFLIEWRQAIEEVDKDHMILADNVSASVNDDGQYTRPQDDWSVASCVDRFGISAYHKYVGTGKANDWVRNLVYSGAHSAALANADGRFWVAEMQTHITHMFSPDSAVSGWELKLWNWEAAAHGADGIIYWMWEPFTKGQQTGARGLVNRRGEDTERLLAAQEIGRVIAQNDEVFSAYKPQRPHAAILYDRQSQGFQKQYMSSNLSPTSNAVYLEGIKGIYKCLWDAGCPADFLIPSDDLETYRQYPYIFLSNQITISRELGDKLTAYTEAGGTLVCMGKLGEVNEFGLLSPQFGGAIHALMGTEPEDGEPVVSEKSVGKGRVYYLADMAGNAYLQDRYPDLGELFMNLLGEDIKGECKSDTKEFHLAVTRGDTGMLIYVFNYTDRVQHGEITLKIPGADRYSGIKELINTGKEQHYGQIKTGEDGSIRIQTEVEGKDVKIFHLIQ